MNKINQFTFTFFALLFITYLLIGANVSIFIPSWLLKILPILTLIVIVYKNFINKKQRIFLIGLLCSALGDFFLDYDPTQFFIFGLASFLFAHLCYLSSLLPISTQRIKEKSYIIIGYIIYGVIIFSFLYPNLANLLIPVFIYMAVLLLMALTTLISTKSNKWLILGGISFVISDSLLGINKFNYPLAHANVYIMISYYFAQFALCMGILKGNDTNKK